METGESRERTPSASALEWLENELRETKANLARLQQQADQTGAQLWDVQQRLRSVEGTIIDFTSQLASLVQIHEEVRHVREQIGRIVETQDARQRQAEEMMRIRQEEVDRLRQESGDVARRAEDLERQFSEHEERFPLLEETIRRMLDQLQRIPPQIDELGRRLSDQEGRNARNLDLIKHIESGLNRMDGELANLRRQDEVVSERVQVYAAQVRRLEESLSKVEEDQTEHRQIYERIEMGRLDRQRMDERLIDLEERARRQQDELADLSRSLGVLDGRDRLYEERLTTMQQQLAQFRQQVKEHLNRLSQFQENEKRRRMSQIEQDIREIRQYGLRFNEE